MNQDREQQLKAQDDLIALQMETLANIKSLALPPAGEGWWGRP